MGKMTEDEAKRTMFNIDEETFEKLKDYLMHKPMCAQALNKRPGHTFDKMPMCDCGLDELLK